MKRKLLINIPPYTCSVLFFDYPGAELPDFLDYWLLLPSPDVTVPVIVCSCSSTAILQSRNSEMSIKNFTILFDLGLEPFSKITCLKSFLMQID